MLGSRKFLIFGIVSAVLLSLIIVSASAHVEEFDSLEFVEMRSGQVRTAPSQPLYKVGFSSSSYIIAFLSAGGYTSDSDSYSVDFPLFLDTGSITGSVTSMYISGGGVFCKPIGSYFADGRFLVSDSPEFYSWLVDTVHVPESDIIVARQGSLLGFVLEVFNSILGVGTSLVAFVVARPVVLIPTVAMILVLSYGVIRRLIKGV